MKGDGDGCSYTCWRSVWLVTFSLVVLCSPVSGEIVLGVVVGAVILCYCMGESVMAMPILS